MLNIIYLGADKHSQGYPNARDCGKELSIPFTAGLIGTAPLELER